jgi:hypothetical protein
MKKKKEKQHHQQVHDKMPKKNKKENMKVTMAAPKLLAGVGTEAFIITPILAFVTQGKTEHMATIVDPTYVLAKADGNLSKLKEDSEILIKWQSTGREESVIFYHQLD